MAMLVGPRDRVGRRRADPDVAAARRRRRDARRAHRGRSGARRCGSSARARSASPRSTRWRTLAKPVLGGLVSTLARVAARRRRGDDRDRDISPAWILALTVVCLVVAGALAFTFARSHGAGAERACGSRWSPCRSCCSWASSSPGSAATWRGSSARRTARSPASASCRSCICASLLVVAVTPTDGDPAGAGRLRAVHHGDRLRLRDDLERQPAGPEDGAARGRVADAPADRAHRRRRRRRGGDPARCSTCSPRRTASPAPRTSASWRPIRCRRRRRRSSRRWRRA